MRSYQAELDQLAARLERPVQLMEVCGTHTVNACRGGVHGLMPESIRLLSGPGCPVCVTAQRYIDALIECGRRPDVTLATYGDMLRVAGAGGSLEAARSMGADVRVVTSALEAVEWARVRPERRVVFAAVGFETTAPATAAAVLAAEAAGLSNFFVLPCHKLVLPAMEMLLEDPELRIDGFLCPGHVAVITGAGLFRGLVQRFGAPCVVVGFEPLQIMEGVLHLVRQIVEGRPRLENLYAQVVGEEGNLVAQEVLDRVFEPAPAAWRALGVLPESGLELRAPYRRFDALEALGLPLGEDHDPPGCRCGDVITGRCLPPECPLFGRVCTPVYPVGPCMVSSEGSCQAHFRYRGRTAEAAT
ncbi:MAG: hydrogenase formation protein HypD [Gemmatimonadetes bacterium]|nr:hydrogenase formation protein HypD [Gemmatimonadota bacterium]